MMRYGYVGLGNLGGHLAASLLKAGFPVTVFDRDRALADRHVAMGAARADSAGDLAAGVDHVITCLPSPAVSETVLREMLPRMRPGATWVENSTLGRDDILRLGALAAEHGVQMMEAPGTGGVHLAARGEITVLAGGDRVLYDLHLPALILLREVGNAGQFDGLPVDDHVPLSVETIYVALNAIALNSRFQQVAF
jgi:3-hydroxyisobutyrate dehydrogenase